MKLTRTALVIMSLLCAGCGTAHVDRVSVFLISGDVVNAETHRPLENVHLEFIDTGFDDVRSRKPIPIDLGYSNALGKFECPFQYWWGTTIGIFIPSPQKTFNILVSKDGYSSQRFQYTATDLQHDEKGIMHVSLHTIFLKPTQE